MTFGWQGFTLDHPEDWIPDLLSGDRREGYVRLSSSQSYILQARWRRLGRTADGLGFLDAYLRKVGRDCRKAGVAFLSDIKPDGNRLGYHFHGLRHGRGLLFLAEDGRTFVLETQSPKKDAASQVLRGAAQTFSVSVNRDRWSMLGLDLNLPLNLRLESKTFVAGRTAMAWRGKNLHVQAERWGLADQLLARHSLEEWSRTVSHAGDDELIVEPEGLRFRQRPKLWKPYRESLIRHQAKLNQITVLMVDYKKVESKPTWDWLN